MTEFNALFVEKDPEVKLVQRSLTTEELKDAAVLVKASYSGINYKDALATIEKGGVIRDYPLTPGIDMSGVVVESSDPTYQPGDRVLVTGFGFGVSAPGGFSEYQKVPAEWLVKLPTALSEKEAMVYGTAGFTAALAVQAILAQNYPKDAPIAVTGASGGVGSIEVALMAKAGYTNITAISRKAAAKDWLLKLGATEVVTPEEVQLAKPSPLARQRFTAVLDTVGGELLATLLPQISYGGAAAICGNAGGIKLNTTVLPFILRGVKLLGIDSVNVPLAERPAIWANLAEDLRVVDQLPYQEITLSEVTKITKQILAGEHEGRTIIKL